MIKKIFQVFVAPFVLGLIALFLNFYIEQTLLTWILSKTFIILFFVAYLFAFPTILYCLKEDLSIIESYKRVKSIVFSLIFVFILTTIFIYGGTLFLIIPGIIFLVWFSFAPFVIIFEEKRGLSALWRSKEITKGKFWQIWGRIILIGISFGLLKYLLQQAVGEMEGIYIFAIYLISTLSSIALWLILFLFYNKEKEKVFSRYTPSKLSKIFFTIFAIPGTFIFLLFLVASFSILFRNYDPYFDDYHFLIQEKEITKEDNLYLLLAESKNTIPEIKDPAQYIPHEMNYCDFIKEKPEEAKKIIDSNKEVYDYFREMTAYSHFVSPLNFDFDISPGKIFAISRAISLNAAYNFYKGNHQEGMSLFLENLRIGKIIANNRHYLLFYFTIGLEKQIIAYKNVLPCINKIEISLEELQDYNERITLMKIEEDSLSRSFSGEYTLGVNILEEMKTSSISMSQPSFLFRPNETKKELYKFYATGVETNSKNLSDRHELLFRPSTSTDFIIQAFRGNIIGRLLNSTVAINFEDHHYDKVKKALLQNKISRVMLSLNTYERKNEILPDKLEELVPEYLSEVPKDPFYENQYLNYSKGNRIIYSEKMNDVVESEKENYFMKF